MPRRRPLLLAALASLALSASGCVHQREKALALIEDGALAPPGAGGAEAAPEPPRGHDPLSRHRGDPFREGRVTPSAVPAADAVPAPEDAGAAGGDGWDVAVPAASAAVLASASLPPPPVVGTAIASAAAPPAHRPLEAGASLEARDREAFLSCESTVEADKATLFVPPSYAAEATLTGIAVSDAGPGRRTATGSAVLRLRRLTIRAREVSLVARADGVPDVSLSARGNVSFRADRPASVIDERGLKSLLVRNSGFTPLR